uniref:Uncharacterized protein n=1 Tax=Picea sitchensis TaxID=3332 RepID=A0A6B9XWZ0_PICSI|nr:hypothetical protein Q903MT_gene5671 [Picea sitchensis]
MGRIITSITVCPMLFPIVLAVEPSREMRRLEQRRAPMDSHWLIPTGLFPISRKYLLSFVLPLLLCMCTLSADVVYGKLRRRYICISYV